MQNPPARLANPYRGGPRIQALSRSYREFLIAAEPECDIISPNISRELEVALVDSPPIERLDVSADIMAQWQEIVDVMAEILDVPASLIMRVADAEIEVFVSSCSESNPYAAGSREHLHGSGLYCETVIHSKSRLHVPDALKDPHWDRNPDIKLNMVAYLGFPVLRPDGEVFGTICVLDREERHFTPAQEKMILRFKELLESHLKLVLLYQEVEKNNLALRTSLEEIKTLRGILPICCICHKVRDDKGYWEAVELYIARHTDASFTHGVCPDCVDTHYPAYAEALRRKDEQSEP